MRPPQKLPKIQVLAPITRSMASDSEPIEPQLDPVPTSSDGADNTIVGEIVVENQPPAAAVDVPPSDPVPARPMAKPTTSFRFNGTRTEYANYRTHVTLHMMMHGRHYQTAIWWLYRRPYDYLCLLSTPTKTTIVTSEARYSLTSAFPTSLTMDCALRWYATCYTATLPRGTLVCPQQKTSSPSVLKRKVISREAGNKLKAYMLNGMLYCGGRLHVFSGMITLLFLYSSKGQEEQLLHSTACKTGGAP